MDSFVQLTEDCDVSLFSALGHGAVSVVHLGRQDIAVKRMYYKDENGEIDEKIKELAMQEIHNFKAMKYHPNIVQYYNYKDDGSSIWIMMEHCNYGALDKYLVEHKLSQKQKIDFMKQITEGLKHMHALGIPHGDLKPANVLIKKDGEDNMIKLSDFSGTGVTGTQPYIAPELFAVTKGRQPVKSVNRVKADIFSMGVLFKDILDNGNSNQGKVNSRGDVFGEMLYEAFEKQMSVPTLFTNQDQVDDITIQLQEMIQSMTLIDVDERISLSDVSYKLDGIDLSMAGDQANSDVNAIKKALIGNYRYLVDIIDSGVLLVHCYSQAIITPEELQYLRRASENYGPTYQNELLLEILLKKHHTELLIFLQILKSTHPQVHSLLQRTIGQTRQGGATAIGAFEDDENHALKETLKRWQYTLCKQLNAREMIPYLLSTELLSMNEFSRLRHVPRYGSFNTNQMLLDTILRKSSQEIKQFIETIKKTNPDVYDKIKGTLVRRSDMWRTDLEEMKVYLIRKYTMKEYHIIQALPGENCQLNLHDKSSVIPLEFTAKKRNLMAKGVYNYTLEFNTIEEVVGALFKKEEGSIMLLTAPPGFGKTVFTHLLISQWVEESNDKLHPFQAVFVIHVRNINVKATILDILGDSRSGSDSMNDEMKATMHNLLCHKKAAPKILMILDGIDQVTVPKDCDLYKLLIGDLYPQVRKVVTSRPEASILNNIEPFYKVEITGISADESHKYLVHKVKTSAPCWDESVLVLLKQLQVTTEVADLLKIPLYLTMFAFVFDKYRNQYQSFRHVSWPNTVTHLFNVFLTFLLRTWLIRRGRTNEGELLEFDRNVLDRDNKVPMDIKSKVLSFGYMSFLNLKKQIYVFTEEDLYEMLIDINDVEESGLFVVTHVNKGIKLSFRHKQLQEFMAAIYLAHGKNAAQLLDKIHQHKEAPLSFLFQHMYSVLPFVFGLSPTVALDILNTVRKGICVASNSNGINISFESRLCFESCDQKVQDTMIQILLDCKTSTKFYHDFEAPVSNVYDLCKELTNLHAQKILEKWFWLKLHCTNDECYIENIESNKEKYLFVEEQNILQIKFLNDFLFFLLLKFSFPEVRGLNIERSNVTDIKRITQSFPNVETLDLDDGNPQMDEFLNNCCGTPLPKIQPSLKDVTFRCYDVPLPMCSLNYLLEESKLEQLKLKWVNLLTTDIRSLPHGSVWPNLTDLEICLWKLEDEVLETVYSNLDILAQYVLQLQSLSLGCNFNNTSSEKRNSLQGKLLNSLQHKFQQLSTLRLHRVMFPSDIEALCLCLQKLTSLHTLGLLWRDFQGKETTLIGNLQSSGHIRNLHVMFGSYDKEQAESAVESLILPQSFSTRNVTVRSWKWDLAVGS